jgi:Cft2 family RNA processing exonuclease
MGGKNIMFDCGMHMGYNDSRRFPDFSFLAPTGPYDSTIDALIVSHFHLDHSGALPHFTEQCGYNGPLIMTYPTKAIAPILLEDYRKIMVERKGEKNFFTSEMIRTCMSKATAVQVHETVSLGADFEVTAYYAGHVIGAAMFHVRVGRHSVLYTGDYNMTPDRHLGAAWVDCIRPDVLITETTYATLVRDSKKFREQDFLNRCKAAVERGGKVLIPVFALGRAQELCILVRTIVLHVYECYLLDWIVRIVVFFFFCFCFFFSSKHSLLLPHSQQCRSIHFGLEWALMYPFTLRRDLHHVPMSITNCSSAGQISKSNTHLSIATNLSSTTSEHLIDQ